jgi:AcrR family transcriptional regulator
LLAAEGPTSLTMRRIAEEIGASTTVLYRLFEGKNGIVDAMVTDGHNALRGRLEEIPNSMEPFDRLAATGRAYREAALADPARYQLMFGSTIPGYVRSGTAREAARGSFDVLAAAVQDCIDAGVIARSEDPRFVAEILVAAAHGAVSLELAGHFEDQSRSDERFAVLSAASVRPFLVNPD